MTSPADVRTRVQGALRGKAALIYPLTLTFTLPGFAGQRVVRCSVRDPEKVDRRAIAAAEVAARQAGVPYSDMRLLKVHPDDPRPAQGMRATLDGGTLEVLSWSQESALTGLSTATCVLRR